MNPVVKKATARNTTSTSIRSMPRPLPEAEIHPFSRGTVLREFAQSAFAVVVLFFVFGGTWLSIQGEKVRAKYLQEKAGMTMTSSAPIRK